MTIIYDLTLTVVNTIYFSAKFMHESIRVVNYAKKKITFLIFFHVIVNRNTDTFSAYQRSERVKINYTHNTCMYLLSEISAISLIC